MWDPAQTSEFAKVMVPLFRQISRCLNSSHFQVRRRGLRLGLSAKKEQC